MLFLCFYFVKSIKLLRLLQKILIKLGAHKTFVLGFYNVCEMMNDDTD